MLTKELCVMTRKKIAFLYVKRYRKARRKKDKSEILDEFERVVGYNRNYASWLLRHALTQQYEPLNPAKLRKTIVKRQRKFHSLATPLKGVYYE